MMDIFRMSPDATSIQSTIAMNTQSIIAMNIQDTIAVVALKATQAHAARKVLKALQECAALKVVPEAKALPDQQVL